MGISFGGLLKSVMNPMSLAQLAMGPAGWASLAMKTIGSQIAMSLIEQIGQKLGLSPAVIDLAQSAFAASSGQPDLMKQNMGEAVSKFATQMDLRPSEAGQLMRDLMEASDKSLENLTRISNSFGKPNGGDDDSETGAGIGAGKGKGGGSWLVAFAKAMGAALDAKAAQIKGKSDSIASMAGSGVDRKSNEGAKHSEKLSSETQLLQAYSQEMSMIANAATNALKTVGEAQTTIARK
jgi:hypothetical protein